MENELINRVEKLEKRYRRTRLMNRLMVMLILAFGLYSYTQSTTFGVIRAKGIVIEDEEGKDRILIGAPIPYSKDRVRTDSVKVRKYWANTFGAEADNYMEYYKDYRHATDGIVVLNKDGFDRVLLGDKLADPNTGKKMFESAGITWNDPKGWELGGAGVNTSEDGNSRGVIGLDDPKTSGEAIHLVALEDGTKALIIGNEQGRLIIGMNATENEFLQTTGPFTGIKYFNHQGQIVWEQKMR